MDLFVNGTSVATGWGTGSEKISDPLVSKSWPHILANKLHCNTLWNHSLPSKPMSFTIADTMGFCEQYYERYGNYDNLFVVIEWLMPHAHGKWSPVYTNSVAYQDQIVLPVVVSQPETPTVYETMYVCKPRNVDYLANKPIYDHVSWKHIAESSRQTHEQEREHYYTTLYSLSRRLIESRQEVSMMQSWLQQRQISYLMFWAFGCGAGSSIRRLVTKTMSDILEQDSRFIPIGDFTSMSYGAEHSLETCRGHPDIHGQNAITEYLWQYMLKNQLLKSS